MCLNSSLLFGQIGFSSIFGEGSYSEWNHYHYIISLFVMLAVNVQKSDFVYSCDDMEIRNQIASLLPYNMTRIEGGFKYLGFFLKPNGYKKGDWEWFKLRRFRGKLTIGHFDGCLLEEDFFW